MAELNQVSTAGTTSGLRLSSNVCSKEEVRVRERGRKGGREGGRERGRERERTEEQISNLLKS